MLSERKKKTIALTLALISFVLNFMIALPYDPLSMLWYKVRLYYWSWVPAFILPSTAIVLTLCWKPGSRMLRGFALFLSILALIIGGIWFSLLFFISHLTP